MNETNFGSSAVFSACTMLHLWLYNCCFVSVSYILIIISGKELNFIRLCFLYSFSCMSIKNAVVSKI